MEGMLDKGKHASGLQKKIGTACKKAGLEHHLEGKDNIMYTLGKKVGNAKAESYIFHILIKHHVVSDYKYGNFLSLLDTLSPF